MKNQTINQTEVLENTIDMLENKELSYILDLVKKDKNKKYYVSAFDLFFKGITEIKESAFDNALVDLNNYCFEKVLKIGKGNFTLENSRTFIKAIKYENGVFQISEDLVIFDKEGYDLRLDLNIPFELKDIDFEKQTIAFDYQKIDREIYIETLKENTEMKDCLKEKVSKYIKDNKLDNLKNRDLDFFIEKDLLENKAIEKIIIGIETKNRNIFYHEMIGCYVISELSLNDFDFENNTIDLKESKLSSLKEINTF